ncbi:MAG: hypothetical protein PHX21_12345 [bacterium]|nr:hypothetical protein [bacterium]
MKKLCFVVFLGLVGIGIFSFNSYGIQNLKINNANSATITTADTFHITGEFEPGNHTAKAILYYDANANGILDTNEDWISKFKLIDGNFDDKDETVNGSINRICDPITITGDFVLYVEDNEVSDTVSLRINPMPSSLVVSGIVTEPANTPNIGVMLISQSMLDADTLNRTTYLYCDFTDSTGTYSIALPEVLRDSSMLIFAGDIIGILPRCYISSPLTVVLISDSQTKDLAMYKLGSDTTVVSGVLKDDEGNPITESVQIKGGIAGMNGAFGVLTKTNSSGYYNYIIKKAAPAYYTTRTSPINQFYTEYLNPLNKNMPFMVAPTQITNNLTAYRTTDSIRGVVYKDGIPHKGAQIDIGVIYPSATSGGTYTKTYSNGRYTAYVNGTFTTYSVKVSAKSVPNGYKVKEENGVNASPGSAGVNFHLIKTSVEENPETNIQSLVIQPNPFIQKAVIRYSLIGTHNNYKIDNSRLMIYDVSGNKIMELVPEYSKNENSYFALLPNNKKMSAGIYFLRIGNFKPMKFIKLK